MPKDAQAPTHSKSMCQEKATGSGIKWNWVRMGTAYFWIKVITILLTCLEMFHMDVPLFVETPYWPVILLLTASRIIFWNMTDSQKFQYTDFRQSIIILHKLLTQHEGRSKFCMKERKKERGQWSGIDTIKHHTWSRIPMGKWQLHN